MMAFATRYDVRTQVTSSMVAERFPAIWGSDTFTTVVSNTSMKVQNITEMAMIQGLTCLGSDITGGMQGGLFQHSESAHCSRGCGAVPRRIVGMIHAPCVLGV